MRLSSPISVMPPQARPTLLWLLLLLLPHDTAAAALGTEAYRLPLVDPYALYRSEGGPGASGGPARYQLVEVPPSGCGVGPSTLTLIHDVESVAIQHQIIFG